MNEKQSKDFKSLEEVAEFLKKFPEMKTGFIHVDFEKKETSGDMATDAMQSEIEQIYHELDAIKDRHPNLKTFHVDFEFGNNPSKEPEPVEANRSSITTNAWQVCLTNHTITMNSRRIFGKKCMHKAECPTS